MKPKRVILIFDEEYNLPTLRVVLQTRGYKTLSCITEKQCEAMMACCFVDLLLVGPRIECSYDGPVPCVVRQPDWSTAVLIEKLRLPLLRKRGPKGVTSKALSEYHQAQMKKASA